MRAVCYLALYIDDNANLSIILAVWREVFPLLRVSKHLDKHGIPKQPN